MSAPGNYDFKRSILRLFVVTITVILLVFVVSTYRWQNQRLTSELAALSGSAEKVYLGAIEQDANMLGATLTGLLANDALRESFRNQDRDALLRQTMPLFQRLRKERQITHFYFIRPDRTVLLRVHMPSRLGDQINRTTLLEAEKTQTMSQGAELGPIGTFTLRVVSPWIEGGRLLGYVELGKEIDGVSATVQHDLNLRSEILIDKTLLKREEWEAGMAMLGRTAQWDLFDHWVLNGAGLGAMPLEMLRHINDWRPGDEGRKRYIADDGKRLLLDAIPLRDAAQRQVGALLIQADVTSRVETIWRSVAFLAFFCLLVGLIAAIAFWVILSKFERLYGHSEEKLRAMFEMSPFGMALRHQNGRYVEVNPAFAEMIGYSAEELTELSHMDITPPQFQDEDIRRMDILGLHRRAGPYVKEYRHRDGHLIPVSLNGMLITGSDGETYVWTLIEDISERLATEQRLNKKSDELARSNAELEAFAYVTSHDLRQPLRSISGYVSLLERQYGEQLDDEGRQFIRFVVDGVKRMDRLIIDVLDYARIGRLTKPKSETSLAVVAADVAFNLRAALEESGGTLTLAEDLPDVWADRTEMVRLLQNLITNALKFRSPDRPPEVRITAEHRLNEVQVNVEDNGIGIKPTDFERIFGIFQRLHSREEYEGSGIGLAVCKKIVEHHGGRIWVEQALPQGSRFCFTLAAVPAENDEGNLSVA